MKQLFLHLGRHKTGSSSLQTALSRADQRLARHGVLYPRATRVGSGSPAHAAFAHWLRRSSSRAASDEAVGELVREIREAPQDIVILACEEMDVSFYIDYQYEKLRAFLERLGPDVKVTVIAHFREQISLLAAEYSQQARQFMQTEGFAQFCDASIAAGWYDHYRMYERLIGLDDIDFVAIPYERVKANGLITTNLDVMGIGDDLVDKLGLPELHVNVSLGPRSVEAYRVIARRLKPARTRYLSLPYIKIRQFLDRRFDELGWNDERYWPWYPELQERIEGAYRESNERFAQAVWGTPWPDSAQQKDPLFVDLEYMGPRAIAEVAELIRSAQTMEAAFGE